MTQKELLYLEDAVNHEQNIKAYLKDSVLCTKDKNLSSFFEDEIKSHDVIYKKLMNLLEDESNEWSRNYNKLFITS